MSSGETAEPFAVRHGRFRDALDRCDRDEFAGLADDEQRIRWFVRGRLVRGVTSGDASEDRRKDGAAALAMKLSGTEQFRKSDYPAALRWYSLAVLHCPQTGAGTAGDAFPTIRYMTIGFSRTAFGCYALYNCVGSFGSDFKYFIRRPVSNPREGKRFVSKFSIFFFKVSALNISNVPGLFSVRF